MANIPAISPSAPTEPARDSRGFTAQQRLRYLTGHPWKSSVYYFQWPTAPFMVKIGWAIDARKRLSSFKWDGEIPLLLAAEPAVNRRLESQRHAQFANLRTRPATGPSEGRTEVFLIGPELDEWMWRLRIEHKGWWYQTVPRGVAF